MITCCDLSFACDVPSFDLRISTAFALSLALGSSLSLERSRIAMAGLGSSSSSNPQQEERPRAAGRSSSSRNVAFPEYGVSSFYQHVQPRDSPSSPNPQQENGSRVAGCSSSSPIRGSIPLCESIAGLSPSIPSRATRNTPDVQTNATEEEDDPWADLRSETPPTKSPLAKRHYHRGDGKGSRHRKTSC